jgi:hypothetical protein
MVMPEPVRRIVHWISLEDAPIRPRSIVTQVWTERVSPLHVDCNVSRHGWKPIFHPEVAADRVVGCQQEASTVGSLRTQ